MSKHVIAFTAEFKIQAVKDRTCYQTIRPLRKKPIKEGDNLLLHGWEGAPYRSKWSWRDPDAVALYCPWIKMDWEHGVWFKGLKKWYAWDSMRMWHIADADGFGVLDPHPEVPMKAYFLKSYGKMVTKEMQIIRWHFPEDGD